MSSSFLAAKTARSFFAHKCLPPQILKKCFSNTFRFTIVLFTDSDFILCNEIK